jgi:hypothetical protein
MVSYIPADQKTDPGVVARIALDGLFAGEREVLADRVSKDTKAQLSVTA